MFNLKDDFKRSGYSVVTGGSDTTWVPVELFTTCKTEKEAKVMKKVLEIANPDRKLRICQHWKLEREL